MPLVRSRRTGHDAVLSLFVYAVRHAACTKLSERSKEASRILFETLIRMSVIFHLGDLINAVITVQSLVRCVYITHDCTTRADTIHLVLLRIGLLVAELLSTCFTSNEHPLSTIFHNAPISGIVNAMRPMMHICMMARCQSGSLRLSILLPVAAEVSDHRQRPAGGTNRHKIRSESETPGRFQE